ncbi:septum site-determining protein Ssd [Corynebacterium glaucum]|uniref:septum site-determining protein Ssd n=1 Tax=Corynebacterium glaucum TaxID=187491 RepID=UPI0025B384D6|nr:septum site-determining protein Ssd [Corynebacterium glaucum]WJZ06692.1 hypothetical protein CGLAUT_00895 [Corynebacterium glaucum]
MTQTQLTNPRPAPILVAVDDPLLHPEALHIAAACGRPVVEVSDEVQLARMQPKAFASLIDGSLGPPTPTPTTFVITASPGAAPPGAFVLPAQAADLLRALGALSLRGEPDPAAAGAVIAVVGAAGGAGVSTLAAAVSARAGAGSVLVDAHPRSGGLDLLLGIEEVPGARWGEIELGEGVIARGDLLRALPSTDAQVAVLTVARTTIVDPFPLRAEDVDAAVAACASDGVTVIDAPVSAIPPRCDLAGIVVPAQLRPAAAAAAIVAQCDAAGIAHGLIVRDCAWASLNQSELERVTGSRVLARLRTCRGLARTIERGGLPARLPRPLAHAADAVLAEATRGAR